MVSNLRITERKGSVMRGVFAVVFLMLVLAGCATAPSQVTNACAIFEQRNGIFNNWRRDAKAAEREFGVPVPVMMATIYTESAFRPYARPPRTKLLGFIPWKRQSTAYGYAQALDGTWSVYREKPAAGRQAVPISPMPSTSSAGITPRAAAKTALH